MKSLTDLQKLAEDNDVVVDESWTREDIMDALRAKIGTFDPDLQIDPAKAQDLKHKIEWGQPEPFKGISSYLTDEWSLEPKLDGARMRLFFGTTSNTMNTGRRSDVTFAYIERADNFPHLRDTTLPSLSGTILDGELMPPVASLTTVSGVTTKGTLNSAMALLNVNPAASILTQEKYGKAVFMAFDVLAVNGESTTHLPYVERRQMLAKIIEAVSAIEPAFQMTKTMDATVENVQACLDAGFEGAMLKRKAAKYLPGKRMADWQKVKRMSTGDFFIIGSVDGKGRNEGKVGSMKVAYYAINVGTTKNDEQFPNAVYCADVAGIDDAFRDELTGPDGKIKAEWLGKVIEVMGQGRTKNGRLRHPHFVRLRPDKLAVDCTADCSIDLFEEV